MSRDCPWYRILDHTGDIAILARAPTHELLYDALTRAFFEVMLDTRTVEPRHEVAVTVPDAVDAEDLVVRYLSELLYLHDAKDWLFRETRVVRLTATEIEALAIGETFDPDRHVIDRQVKAVTHHHLLLSQDHEGWSARCVLDL